MKKKLYKTGETVYVEGYTSMASSGGGKSEIREVEWRFDEITGERFPIYKVDNEWYDGRNGACHSNPMFMYGLELEDDENYKNGEYQLTKEDKDFLWSLMPEWVKEVPIEEDSFDPMFFGTLSREGDLEVHEIVKKLLDQE
jgi:hypothetical protein